MNRWRPKSSAVLLSTLTLWICLISSTSAFAPFLSSSTTSPSCHPSTSLFAMNRKARRMQKKKQESKGKARLREIIKDEDDSGEAGLAARKSRKVRQEATDDQVYLGDDEVQEVDVEDLDKDAPVAKDSVTGGGTTMADKVAQIKEERPEVSRIILDDETGIEVVEQGQKVMDVVTRQAVKLSDMGPEYRLAQAFPGVPPQVREKYRFDNNGDVFEITKQFQEACSVKREDGTVGLPPVPSIANKGLDFAIANRDRMGDVFGRFLVANMIKNQYLDYKEPNQGYLDKARDFQKLAQHHYLMDNYIAAPFRQIILDGEERIGPNFGNLDFKSYCGKELYERTADYLVLKGMVSHWAKKYTDVVELEELGPLNRDMFDYSLTYCDPQRFLKDNQIIWEKQDCEQILAMALKMCNMYVETPELFDDLPVEVRFIEQAQKIRDGTVLRKFVVEEFCPKEGIEPAGLREGIRRLLVQLDTLQLDPYEDIADVVYRIKRVLEQGSDDEGPFERYMKPDENNPGSEPWNFPTYTFDFPRESISRFLDFADEKQGETENQADVQDVADSFKGLFSSVGEMFGLPDAAQDSKQQDFDDGYDRSAEESYRVPQSIAMGRDHDLGWLDSLDDTDDDLPKGQIPPGKIIYEE